MDADPPPLPDLPIDHQARASISLALRLNAEGKTEEATAIFETLGRQMRARGPTAVLIEGDAMDADASRSLEVLVAMVRACAAEISEEKPNNV